MFIISGANSSHGYSLVQLIESINHVEPNTKLIVYDLGLTPEQRTLAKQKIKNGIFKVFDFSSYPAFYDINVEAGQYAWKPAIIWAEMQEHGQPVCWMDAGNVVKRPLKRIRRELNRIGFYSESSKGTIPDWTHPGMLDYFGLDRDWGKGLRNLNGACIAFDPNMSLPSSVAEQWANCARIEKCIAPQGSSRQNHRQDQALLSVLAYQSGLVHRPTPRPKLAWRKEFITHQDID